MMNYVLLKAIGKRGDSRIFMNKVGHKSCFLRVAQVTEDASVVDQFVRDGGQGW